MARQLSDIRDDIERLTGERSRVYRALLGATWNRETLVEQHAELDKRLRWLWEEFRDARCRHANLRVLTPAEAMRLARRMEAVALA